MGTAKATRAADKSQVCRRLVQALQKLYGKTVPQIQLPVLETMLFAVCLEDNRWDQAEAGLKRLISSFFDLNEIRVSSVAELERALDGLTHADWKGMRIRAVLRHVFEGAYAFEFEKLRRMTLEQAIKALKKIQELSPFVRDFVLHEILGNHVVYLDESMLRAACWLGLVPAGTAITEASEYLKSGIRKSEVSEFCNLLKSLATDVRYAGRLAEPLDGAYDMGDVLDRLAELQSPRKKSVKPVAEAVKPERAVKSSEKPAKAEQPAAKKSAAAKPASGKSVAVAPAGKASAARDKGQEASKAAAKSANPTKKTATGRSAASGKKASTAGKPASGKSSGSKNRR